MSTLPDNNGFRLVGHTGCWRAWDGAAVIFEPLSGDTHRVAPPGGSILTLLAQSEASKIGLMTALQSTATADKIDEALELLQAMELVESI